MQYHFFGKPIFASRIGQCAGDALGISTVAAALRYGVNSANGKKLLKKAIRKAASRALGWVGAAIFAYEFGDSMDWWSMQGSGSNIINVSCNDLLSVKSTKNN